MEVPMGRGTVTGFRGSYSGWSSAACSFPSASMAASLHTSLSKDHSSESASFIPSVQASLLVGFHPRMDPLFSSQEVPCTCNPLFMEGTSVEAFMGCSYHAPCSWEKPQHSGGEGKSGLHLGCSHRRLLS